MVSTSSRKALASARRELEAFKALHRAERLGVTETAQEELEAEEAAAKELARLKDVEIENELEDITARRAARPLCSLACLVRPPLNTLFTCHRRQQILVIRNRPE